MFKNKQQKEDDQKIQQFVDETKGLEGSELALERAFSQDEAAAVLASCTSVARLPDGTDFAVNLSECVSVTAGEDGKTVRIAPVAAGMEKVSVRWCQALAAIPHKKLPRSQRPIVKLLQRLPEEPTGVPSIDRGRTAILQGTSRSLWPAMRASLQNALLAAAKPAVAASETPASETAAPELAKPAI